MPRPFLEETVVGGVLGGWGGRAGGEGGEGSSDQGSQPRGDEVLMATVRSWMRTMCMEEWRKQ